MSVHKDKKRGGWIVFWRDEFGKSHKKRFGKGSEAKKTAQTFDYELKLRRSRGEPTINDPKNNMYFDKLAQLWINEKVAQGRSRTWLKEWTNVMQKYLLKPLCAKPINKLQQKDIIEIIGKRYVNHSQSTRNRYLSYLKGMFQFAVDYEYLDKNPLQRWKKTKEAPRKTMLTIVDLQKIIAVSAPHLKWAIEVEFNLGLRAGPSELFVIKWSQIDWENSTITVYGRKTKNWRIIPLSDDFAKKLKQRKGTGQSAYIIEYKGRPVKSLRRALSSACRRADIDYSVCMTDIRHLFATTLLQGGADLAAVSALMGHSSTKMTADQYYHLHEGEKRKAIDKLPQLTGTKEHNGQTQEPCVVRLKVC